MRITFTQTGGFAGVVRGCRIDAAGLPAGDRRALEALVAASGLDASFERFAAAARDLRQYEIRIDRGEGDVACVERSRPWRDVHRMFYEACRCGGVAAVTAKMMYYAVFHFGPRWRVEERRTIVAGASTVERVVHDETPPSPSPAEAEAIARWFAAHDVPAEAIPDLKVPPDG